MTAKYYIYRGDRFPKVYTGMWKPKHQDAPVPCFTNKPIRVEVWYNKAEAQFVCNAINKDFYNNEPVCYVKEVKL